MKPRHFLTAITSVVVLLPVLVNAQGHEVYAGEMINVEYGGRAPERPDPGGRGGSDRSPSDIGAGKTGTSDSSPKSEQTLVSFNGETFIVSEESKARLVDFLESYRTSEKVGGFFAAVASIFSLFGLFNLDSAVPNVDAMFRIQSFNAEEVLVILSAPNTWNLALRAQAAAYCEQEMGSALFQKREKDAQMWLRLRDIFANPERYRNGGLQIKDNKLMLRSFPAEAYRSIAGFSAPLTAADQQELGVLTNYLLLSPETRDYIIYADYIYGLARNEALQLSMRDDMYLNLALLRLDQGIWSRLDKVFRANSLAPQHSYEFWAKLQIFLRKRAWNYGLAVDSEVDPLGFATDELPNPSDLVTGKYPSAPMLQQGIPPTWNVPAQRRQEVYHFYYAK